jgi:hypothetical protein
VLKSAEIGLVREGVSFELALKTMMMMCV